MSMNFTALHHSPVRFGKSVPNHASIENEPLIGQTTLSTPVDDQVEIKKGKPNSVQPPYQPYLSGEPAIEHAKSVRVPVVIPEVLYPQMPMHLLQKLFLQSMVQQPKDGHIKLHVGAEQSINMHGYGWLGDMLTLVGKPIDVIMESNFEKAGLCALLNAHRTGGQAYMMPDSALTLLAPNNMIDQMLNHSDAQKGKRLSEQSLDALATLIAEKSGETDREKILQDLRTIHGNNKTWNPLQALKYGKTGMIDGIPLPGNRVVTRNNLDQYLAEHNITSKEQIDEFLENHRNVYKLPNESLKQAFPGSLPEVAKSIYRPIYSALLQKEAESNVPEPKVHIQPLDSDKEQKVKDKPIPQQMHLSPLDEAPSYAISTHGKNNSGSILSNDTIFYGDHINSKDIGKLIEVLLALDSKKAQEKDPKHIQLILSSPGGDPGGMQLFKNTLRSIKSPVDILITNRACSAAADMLTGTIGLRLALPQSTLMIHEGSTRSLGSGNELIEACAREISARTGRPFDEVMEDQKQDYYLNALEGLCYGPKGYIDGIVIGGNRMITRTHAMAYLSEQLGSPEKAEKYVEEKLQQLRDPKQKASKKAGLKDPFANPLKAIYEIAARGTVTLGEDPALLHSGGDTRHSYFEHHNIQQKPKDKIKDLFESPF